MLIDPEAESFLRGQLTADERLLWSGQPPRGIRLRASDAFIVPFTLMWGGFAFFWEFMVFQSNAPLFFRLWGVPFVLVGIYLIAGRFFWDAYQRGRTTYGITSDRVLIVTSGAVNSLPLRTLNDITLTPTRGGRGTILFGTPGFGSAARFAQAGWPMGRSALPQFDSIEDAQQAYQVIQQAQRSLR